MHDTVAPLSAAPSALLIAEDKVYAAQLLQDWVTQEYPRCRISHAANAEDARRVASVERPAVILVDIDMYDAKGFEILRVLRTDLPEVHLIALSMFHADAYRDYAAGAGAEACLSMAGVGSKLKDMIGALLASSRGRAQT